MTSFELWDRESLNLIGEFYSRDEALAFVRSLADQDGELSAAALSLTQATGGEALPVAAGRQLLELAGVFHAA